MAEQICVCPQCGKKYKLKEEFDAKSFSCKGCGATVWVGGKPPAPAPTSRRSSGGAAPTPHRRGRTAAKAAAGGRAGRRSRGRQEEEPEEEGGRRGRGREKPKSSANILMAVGAVAIVGIIVAIALMSGKKGKEEGGQQPVAQQPGGGTGEGLAATGNQTPTQPATQQPTATGPGANAGTTGSATDTTPTGEGTTKDPTAGDGEEDGSSSSEGGETPTKLGGKTKRPDGLTPHAPPATLSHLESTPPDLRKQIDDLIAVMFDPMAGRDGLDAKEKLIAIGKPAFLPILGKMAVIRDTITDTDSMEERQQEASLMLADQCLRGMDGFLDARGKQIIRPGTDKKYLSYILVLHYRRWTDGLGGGTPLKDMPEMPGAFDPSKLPPEDPDEQED